VKIIPVTPSEFKLNNASFYINFNPYGVRPPMFVTEIIFTK